MSELMARFRGLFRRAEFERGLDDEMLFHLETRIAELGKQGTGRHEAEARARREFGPRRRATEESREAWRLRRLADFMRDARFALRMLRKNPGFTAIAVLTLALGIGATTTIFAVVDAVLIRPLPYPDSNSIVHLSENMDRHGTMSIAYANFADWAAMNRAFSSIGAIRNKGMTMTGGTGPAEQLMGREVSHGFLDVLQTRLALGRNFGPADDVRGAAPTAIISYKLWQQRFSGDPNIIGRGIALDGKSYTIIGVLPSDYYYNDESPDALIPVGTEANEAFWQNRFSHGGTGAIARMKAGVTLDAARADMDRVAQLLQQQHPDTNAHNWVTVLPLKEWLAGDLRSPLTLLLIAVGVLLVIACGNTANLCLAKGSARRREVAIRAAIGASRTRLVWQFLTESTLLALLGGIGGVALALWGTHMIVAAVPDLPRISEVRVNIEVLAFAFALSVVTGILFGALPAVRVPVGGEQLVLKESERGAQGRGQQRVSSALMVGQIGLSLALLLVAGLLIRSFERVMQVSPGFNPQRLVTGVLRASDSRYKTVTETQNFYNAVMANIRAIPGVTAASAISPLPMSGNQWATNFLLEGSESESTHHFPEGEYGYLGAGYVEAMQILLSAGRSFDERDTPQSQPVVVVNQEFVRMFCDGKNPVGRRIRFGDPKTLSAPASATSPWAIIVGVIGNVKQYGLDERTVPTMYANISQVPSPGLYAGLVIRTAVSDPLSIVPAVRAAIAKVDAGQAVSNIATMEERSSLLLASRRLFTTLLAVFAALALALGTVGIYGVLAYSVARRTAEIGIRMALGASRGAILWRVLAQGLKMSAVGIVIGVGIGAAATRVMKALLFEVRPSDPVTYASGVMVILLVTIAACWVPAIRAMRVDPVEALRSE
jgi:putative ABC transport system permease protein